MSRRKHVSDHHLAQLRPQIDVVRGQLHRVLLDAPDPMVIGEVLRKLHAVLYPANGMARKQTPPDIGPARTF